MTQTVKIIVSLLLIMAVKGCAKHEVNISTPNNMFVPYRFNTLTLPDGLKINYNVQGKKEGRNIVLVHGGGDSQTEYNPLINDLKKEYSLITFDLPGHGLSDPLPNPQDYTMDKFSEIIGQIVEKLNIEDFIIVGHSFGGDAVARYVLANPKKVKGMILIASGGFITAEELKLREQIKYLTDEQAIKAVFGYQDPNASFTRNDIRQSIAGFFHSPDKISNATVERFFVMAHYEPNKGAYNQMQINYFRHHKDLSGLNTLQTPTLLLWGAKDKLVPVSIAQGKFNKQIPNSILVILDDVGHLPIDEASKKSSNSIVDFLTTNNL